MYGQESHTHALCARRWLRAPELLGSGEALCPIIEAKAEFKGWGYVI